MKKFFRTRVVNLLSFLSRETLAKYNPIVIGITGNVGKTTTKDYIYSFLNTRNPQGYDSYVRASQKSENSEFGMNLTILGEKNPWNSPNGWIKIIIRNFLRLYKNTMYPKILVLEVGADKPGDIKFLTTIIKPDVVVLTAFQQSPSHGEFFSSIEQHINEKKYLVERMKKEGVIVYNADDDVMSKMAEEKKLKSPKVQLLSFGQKSDSNICILENTNLYNEDADIIGTKIRLGIKFTNISDEIELRIQDVVGEAQAYSIAAAVAVAIINNFKKEELLNVIRNFERNFVLSKSRMRILQGVNDSRLIDDSYNSSPKAAVNAIETVAKILSKGKKIAVLGHMAELGEKTKQEHIRIGELAAKVFDVIIFSGRYNEYYLEGVRNAKADLSRIFLAKDAYDVLKIMSENNIIKTNDLILLKGSQSARIEKVVVELLVNPRDREEVCRQDKEWQYR